MMAKKTKRVEQLKEAIEHLHKCKASHKETSIVHEHFEDELVWEGTVEVFCVDHPDTDTCFVWSSPIEDSNNRKLYAVLKIPPIETPNDAVRASIVRDYQTGRS